MGEELGNKTWEWTSCSPGNEWSRGKHRRDVVLMRGDSHHTLRFGFARDTVHSGGGGGLAETDWDAGVIGDRMDQGGGIKQERELGLGANPHAGYLDRFPRAIWLWCTCAFDPLLCLFPNPLTINVGLKRTDGDETFAITWSVVCTKILRYMNVIMLTQPRVLLKQNQNHTVQILLRWQTKILVFSI